jgi:hypothetical protein
VRNGKKLLLATLLLLVAAYVAWGLGLARARAERRAWTEGGAPELRGAYHVHTTASDGRGTLAEVVGAARAAGLDFVVVTDHNVRAPERAEYVDGVLVVPATEVSTQFGHVVALGVPRALTPAERDGDPLGAIAALGGQAVLAHPLHPSRPFTGWGRGAWRGFEVVSNDTSWYRVVVDRDVARVAKAALALPWDRGRAELALGSDPAPELARFDELLRAAEAAPGPRPARVLLCSADAHGWPSYRAAFEAFSMRVPVARTGDAAADARAVTAALLDGSGACVADALGAAGHVRLAPAPATVAGPGAPRPTGLDLSIDAPRLEGAEYRLLRDGQEVFRGQEDSVPGGRALVRLPCGAAACAPGDYRAEVKRDGLPWIFTNPVRIE